MILAVAEIILCMAKSSRIHFGMMAIFVDARLGMVEPLKRGTGGSSPCPPWANNPRTREQLMYSITFHATGVS